MTAQNIIKAFHETSRLRRVFAVLGLCLLTMPITGFWVNGADSGRGVCAIRMRVDFAADSRPPSSFDAFSRATADSFPLSLNKTRFRATLRDAPPPSHDVEMYAAGKQNIVALYNNQVALALADDTYLPLRRISNIKPSQTYQFWERHGAFFLIDKRRASKDPMETAWLTNPDWTAGRECGVSAETSLAADMRRLALRMQLPFMPTRPSARSAQYMEPINQAAKRFGLSAQLIYAIMRTESAFNPFAVSNAGALGLMQLVPDTAGNEVHAYLTGKAGKPTRTMLFDPKSNIEYGSAYLHLLATRYFAAVTNKASRELCMIAAYNAGPSAVLKVFGSKPNAAVAAINALTPEELFATLSRRMPAEETRQYVGRVLASIESFPR